jgi:hypothetical protein
MRLNTFNGNSISKGLYTSLTIVVVVVMKREVKKMTKNKCNCYGCNNTSKSGTRLGKVTLSFCENHENIIPNVAKYVTINIVDKSLSISCKNCGWKTPSYKGNKRKAKALADYKTHDYYCGTLNILKGGN